MASSTTTTTTAAPVVRSCNPTDPAKTGHALVIVHYLDKTTNTRTFFIVEESSYIERDEVNNQGAVVMNSSGKAKKERFRRFPSTVTNNAGRTAHIVANANYVANPTSQYVLRPNARRGNMKYTLQLPNGIWGFPKGSGHDVSEDSKDIAAREFLEEIGYTLDKNRLVYKKCVETQYYDNDVKKQFTRQTVVFHYELNNADDTEKKAVEAAFAAKTALRQGEVFNAGFFLEADVLAKRKNKPSEYAFANFATDHSTVVDQTTIPRGGDVLPPSNPTPGAYRPPAARGIPPGTIRGTNPTPPSSSGSSGKYVIPARRPNPGGGRRTLSSKKRVSKAKKTRRTGRKKN